MSTKLAYLVLALPLLASCKATESSEPAQPMEASVGRGEIDMDEIMAEMMAKATPGAQHALLQTLVGEWDDTLRMRMSADQPWVLYLPLIWRDSRVIIAMFYDIAPYEFISLIWTR